MSVIQAADIVKGIEICIWIHENCFTQVNRADIRYLQFGADVAKLQPTLKRLLSAFNRSLLHRGSDSPDDDLLRREAKGLIGDFNVTLKECKELLETHKGIVRDGTGFIDNVIWGASTKKRVDDLRARLQSDIQRIEFFLESVKLEQYNSQAGDIQEILTNTRQLLGLSTYSSLEPVPEWLDVRFQKALEVNAPTSFSGMKNIPLEDSHEALYRHYRESVNDNSPSDQSMDQYLHLLKAQWILETIKQSGPFRALRPGSCYIRTVTRLEQLICEQFAWPGLVKFSDEELQKLNDSAFLIWPPQKTTAPKQLTEPNGLEEKVLEISLPESPCVRKEDLVVFQRGPTTLRLARNITPVNGVPRQESEKLSTHIDRFIPLYAVPPSKTGSPALTFKICDGKGGGGTPYEFKCERDVFAFQKAVTGFEVMSDMKRVEWSFNRKKLKLMSKGIGNLGRVQLWRWNPLSTGRSLQMGSAGSRESEQSASRSQSSESSRRSDLTNPTIAKVVRGEKESLFAVTESDRGETVLAVASQPSPVLFIYAKEDGAYSLLHLELRPGLGIGITSCQCRKSEERCKRTVIENIDPKHPQTFTVRRLHAPLDLWDVSVFGLPEHPASKDPKQVERFKCDYLNLDFDSVAERRKFNQHVRVLLKLRDDADAAYNRTVRRAMTLSDKVSNTETSNRAPAPTGTRTTSISTGADIPSLSRVTTTPPAVRQVSVTPNFTDLIQTAMDLERGYPSFENR
ncbi:hypothetical protein P152DRAFT_303584 [Eremomyces bilateralis CBS 781.70]|uniref:Uncharacterized protein n=1 Tax=Eremomyces bilateralis CBS 781.70 TaxID=1392243 RepID=A0A6G1G7S1_9PEZI|nr:uncharacterized protein P152DRAFT_303584 [Eremomyces bilateralis CBS 781.70]KAF1814074.1 hypothetical protein P152DRAFT_303584 [Eremomyces bilateralis CBS 781.70]